MHALISGIGCRVVAYGAQLLVIKGLSLTLWEVESDKINVVPKALLHFPSCIDHLVTIVGLVMPLCCNACYFCEQ